MLSNAGALLTFLIASIATVAADMVDQDPTAEQLQRWTHPGLLAAKLPGAGISSYSLGSDHLSLRLPISCRPASMTGSRSTGAGGVYSLRAPFHIVYVQVTFVTVDNEPAPTGCRISHGDVGLQSNVANFSLGLGPNSLTFTAQPLPTGSNSSGSGSSSGSSSSSSSSSGHQRIRLHIRRLERPQLKSVKSHDDAGHLQVCQLIQECDFVHSDGQACGLGPATGASTDGLNWSRWLRLRRLSLQECRPEQLASAANRWFIPCASCASAETCAWQLARWWHPDCRLQPPQLDALRQKLDGARVVFLGDSTLRGLMFSLYRAANGSLHRWEKSHDSLILSGHNGRSAMAFAYYPQFWLPSHRAPSFRNSLKRILSMSQNQTLAAAGDVGFNKTAILIGGAQWLTTKELEHTRDLLDQLGLSAPVIVKDLSPGFHIRVPGVTFKPLSRAVAQDLADRNADLQAHALSLGFSLLPTFRLTAARYREFHPGKCACHFHTVQRRRPELNDFEISGDIHRTCLHVLGTVLHSVL